MLDAIIEPVKNYYNELPDNTMYCVGRSAVFSFVVSVLLKRGSPPEIFQSSLEDFRRPLFASGCAAAASLIHGLMTPFFNRLFGDDDQNKVHREFITFIVDISLVKLSILTTSGNVGEVAAKIGFGSINWFKSLVFTFSNFCDWLIPVPPYLTQYCHDWGLASDPNSSSTYLVL